jgi:hypothetical protein
MVSLAPYTTIEAGERGTVVYEDEVTGESDIRMDRLHRGLTNWDNCVWLVPGETPEIEEAVHVVNEAPL